MKYNDTRLQDIYLHLKNVGNFETYFPAQHKGECTSKYVVVKTGITSQVNTFTSTQTEYDILCYVPQSMPSQMDVFFEEVKNCMKMLNPMIRPAYTETEMFYDDTVKGYMRSVQYINYRKF
nr:MAG TPA: tail completion protein [Caudoviricetes sp.]